MKGTQKITLSAEAVNEAVQEYLQKRSLESVSVEGCKGEVKPRTYGVGGTDETELTVTFTATESF